MNDTLSASLGICRPLASAMQVVSLLQSLGGVLLLVLLGFWLVTEIPPPLPGIWVAGFGGSSLVLGLLTYWPSVSFRSAARVPADLPRALRRLRWAYTIQAVVGVASLVAAVLLLYSRGQLDLGFLLGAKQDLSN